MNCRDINSEPSFVFKISRKALELALKMDQNVEDGKERSILTFEWVYINGIHSCVIGSKTLTMWTYHSGMRRVMNLAIMDSEHENTEMLTLFLNLFNSALQDLTSDATYKFNPYGIMCNENWANFNAIVNVFGKEYLERTVTCQWHFRRCANRQIAKVNKLERESFKNLVNAICYSNTANDYNSVSNALDKICECNKITNWFEWWKEHEYHIVPAYRGFCLSGLNLAETGQSAIKNRFMWLSVATWRDICYYMVQDIAYKEFLRNDMRINA